MEIQQLRYFLAVARLNNFSRAAEQCHVSQPSLSQQVMKLEAELGERLFERTRREVRLTEAGRLLLPHAEQVMRELELAREKVGGTEGVLHGRIALGVIPTVAPYYLPGALRAFADKFPEVKVEVHEDTTAQLSRAVQTGEIDLALVSLPVEQRGLATIALFEEPLLAALPAEHPLARKRRLTPADLADEAFILMQEGHCLAGQTLAFCQLEGIAPRVSFRSAQIETVRAFVAAGWGVSVVPRMASPTGDTTGDAVCYRPLAGMRRVIGFITDEQRPPGRTTTALVEFFKTAPAAKPRPRVTNA